MSAEPSELGREAVYSRYSTRSPEEIRDALAVHYYDLALDLKGPPEDFRANLGVSDLGPFTIGRLSLGTEVRLSFGEPGYYHLAVPLEGAFSVQQGSGEATWATPRQAVFFDPEYDIRVDGWSGDCDALTVKLDKAAVHAQLESLLGRRLARAPRFAPSFDVTRGPGRSWVSLATWGLRDHEEDGGLLQQDLFRVRFEQSLMSGLLLAVGHSHREQLEIPHPSAPPAAVTRVMDAVRERPGDPYDAAGLAAIARVGVRSLQDAFRRYVGMSPTAFVNEVRLQHVHAQLLRAEPGTTTVAEVGYQWGFTHLGRFGQRYRARFGETPSQTLRRAA